MPRTVDKVNALILACSSALGSRWFLALNCATCWSIAVFMNMASSIGAGPLMVIETEVLGAQRSKPSYNTFMSSSVQMDTPELPTLP